MRSLESPFWFGRAIKTSQAPFNQHLCALCERIFDVEEEPSADELRTRLAQLRSLPEHLTIRALRTFQEKGIVQSLVHSIKYQEMPRLGRKAGRLLAQMMRLKRDEIDLVLPVPLHRTRFIERGFNQSSEIARGVEESIGLPRIRHALIERTRATRSQTKLSVAERVENVEGAFRLNQNHAKMLSGKRIILIDDVMTTGSTLLAVANEIDKAAPKSISLIVFAATALPTQ